MAIYTMTSQRANKYATLQAYATEVVYTRGFQPHTVTTTTEQASGLTTNGV